MSFVYLASPYSDDRADVREKRYRMVCEKAARMMMQVKFDTRYFNSQGKD